MSQMVKTIRDLEPDAGAGALNQKLKNLIDSSDEERRGLIETMANLGLIRPFGDLLEKYKRVHPAAGWSGPASIWTGKDGVNIPAFKHYFPRYVQELLQP